jgi:hypothetical protein
MSASTNAHAHNGNDDSRAPATRPQGASARACPKSWRLLRPDEIERRRRQGPTRGR